MCPPPQNIDIEKERELERQARIEASLREREREVQKARSEQTKEIDREREQHKREEAIQHFKALMSDMVRRFGNVLKNNFHHFTVRSYHIKTDDIPHMCSVFECLKSDFLSLQVRSSDATWSETRRNLRKDHRWESSSLLEREEKEKLFNEHVEALAKKKKEQFRQLLDETSMVRGNYVKKG